MPRRRLAAQAASFAPALNGIAAERVPWMAAVQSSRIPAKLWAGRTRPTEERTPAVSGGGEAMKAGEPVSGGAGLTWTLEKANHVIVVLDIGCCLNRCTIAQILARPGQPLPCQFIVTEPFACSGTDRRKPIASRDYDGGRQALLGALRDVPSQGCSDHRADHAVEHDEVEDVAGTASDRQPHRGRHNRAESGRQCLRRDFEPA